MKRGLPVPQDSYVIEALTTEDLPPHERADFWSEMVTDTQYDLDCRYRRPGDFHGGVFLQRTDAYQLVEFWSEGVEYRRTPGLIRRHPDEDYRFLLPQDGPLTLSLAEARLPLVPGVASLAPGDVPLELLQRSSVRSLMLTIPAREVNEPLNRTSPLMTGVDLSRGLGKVASTMLTTLTQERESITARDFDAACDRVVELLCLVAAGDDRPTVPGALGQVETMVRRYVREHAADPDLNSAKMARDLGWSLRQVQLALHQSGTTARDLIREERLRLVRERLRNPCYQDVPITDLAYALGFSSPSAMSTAFRNRFGMSPREARYGRSADAPAFRELTAGREDDHPALSSEGR